MPKLSSIRIKLNFNINSTTTVANIEIILVHTRMFSTKFEFHYNLKSTKQNEPKYARLVQYKVQ